MTKERCTLKSFCILYRDIEVIQLKATFDFQNIHFVRTLTCFSEVVHSINCNAVTSFHSQSTDEIQRIEQIRVHAHVRAFACM